MRMLTSLVILSVLFAAQVAALPSGAPVSSCTSMAPFHIPFIFGQQGVAPFSIVLSSEQASPRSPITVTLKTNGVPAFKGYLIQARSGNSIKPIGTFTVAGESNTGKTINCPGGIMNAVTHTSRTDKTSETFLWTPPANFKGQVVMMATVVVKYNEYYKGVQSKLITVRKKG